MNAEISETIRVKILGLGMQIPEGLFRFCMQIPENAEISETIRAT